MLQRLCIEIDFPGDFNPQCIDRLALDLTTQTLAVFTGSTMYPFEYGAVTVEQCDNEQDVLDFLNNLEEEE